MWQKRIESNPHIMGGRPCIKGRRIPVSNILEELAEGQTFEEVMKYNGVSREDIEACLKFAAGILEVYWEKFIARPEDIDNE